MAAPPQGRRPQRTCIVCGRRQDQDRLWRVALGKEGGGRLDVKRRLGGRGAYVCPRHECLEKLMNNPKRGRVFYKRPLDDEAWDELVRELGREVSGGKRPEEA